MTVAAGNKGTPKEVDEATTHEKTNAEAVVARLVRIVELREDLKDVWNVLGRNSDARVTHTNGKNSFIVVARLWWLEIKELIFFLLFSPPSSTCLSVFVVFIVTSTYPR